MQRVVGPGHVDGAGVAPVQVSGRRIGGHGVLAVVNDDVGLPLLEVPHLRPRRAAVVAPRKPSLKAVQLGAVAVERVVPVPCQPVASGRTCGQGLGDGVSGEPANRASGRAE